MNLRHATPPRAGIGAQFLASMNDNPVSPTPLDADAAPASERADAIEWAAGWSVEARDGAPWVAEAEGIAMLRAPDDAAFVVVELYARGPGTTPVRVTLGNCWTWRTPGYGPYLDVGVRLAPNRWHTVAFPLAATPQPGEKIAVSIAIDRPMPAWLSQSQRLRQLWRYRRLWVRDIRLRGGQATAAETTIVVLNWRRADETMRCLESLAGADLGGARVLVVDNGSDDGSVERIRQRFPTQQVVTLPQNRGYAGGNNAGIAAALAAGARAVLLLNNDTEVARDFLAPLLWSLNSDPRAAAVSSAILRADHPDLLDVAYLSLYWGHGIVRHHGVNALPGEGYQTRCDVDVAVGCSVLLSSEALGDIGPLNPDYFAYHEEVDWCTRARRAERRILYQPLSRVWHGGSKSTDHLARPLAAARAVAIGPQLPMSIPLSWNPVRTYLGARNTVRFVRLNGTWRERAYFWLHSAYAVPLEALAAVMRQETALKIGVWSYRRALQVYARGAAAAIDPQPARIGVRELLALPRVLLIALPRDIRAASREGRLGQIVELLRGLRDGALNRPLPLERLGLR